MRTWNKADAALLLSAVLFLCALFLHIRFADSLWVRALLAVSEAALVGGVADWFAVTAIFRKPLGFPYHTALLPRRRDSFVQAIVTMVQKEFFSKRNGADAPLSNDRKLSAPSDNGGTADRNDPALYSCILSASEEFADRFLSLVAPEGFTPEGGSCRADATT